jgi:hypothetical protein
MLTQLWICLIFSVSWFKFPKEKKPTVLSWLMYSFLWGQWSSLVNQGLYSPKRCHEQRGHDHIQTCKSFLLLVIIFYRWFSWFLIAWFHQVATSSYLHIFFPKIPIFIEIGSPYASQLLTDNPIMARKLFHFFLNIILIHFMEWIKS